MKKQNNNEEIERNQTQNFLPSDGASCSESSIFGRDVDCPQALVENSDSSLGKWKRYMPDVFDPDHPSYNHPNNTLGINGDRSAATAILVPAQERWLG